jgi:hypothetical protein
MKVKGIVIALLAGLSLLGSCAEETCPVAMRSDAYHFRKKSKAPKIKSKRKPTPSLIHITRVNYKPTRGY